jgi:IstB-like ATP binding protein
MRSLPMPPQKGARRLSKLSGGLSILPIFLGLVGLGKTHLATALGYAACQHGRSGPLPSNVSITLPSVPRRGQLYFDICAVIT